LFLRYFLVIHGNNYNYYSKKNLYLILLIGLIAFILSWMILRHFSALWVRRPINAFESFTSGMAAWLHVFAHLTWYTGMFLTMLEFLKTHDITDIWILLFAAVLTGYAIDFYVKAQEGVGIEDTKEFLKEALQFRRSAQHRLDVLGLLQQRRVQRQQYINFSDPNIADRMRLQENLNKEDEIKRHLSLLQRGNAIDLNSAWKQIEDRSRHPFIDAVEEVRIDPQRKRLMLQVMFSEEQEDYWADEANVLRLNRHVYEFFRFLNLEPFLKSYAPFIESYFLICHRTKKGYNGQPIAYPFMKVGMTTADVQKLEGTYFNPRRLSEFAAVAFAQGDRV
jgi:hypothetical protein